MDKKKNIRDLVKELQNKKYPMALQEVNPIIESINKEMVQCNFDIHPDLKKRLKFRALEDGHSIKEIITTAIREYLGKH
ncbi:MAG: hypothetical protein ABJN95_17010 [Maribacter sp.]|uniref:hypothetical protein n=1 Tax=Maribacter sp. TaxID=1897614 RepID=UPI003296E4CF